MKTETAHLLYLSLIASIVAYTLQLHGQKYVVASTASTIYLVEPASAPSSPCS
jgi:drug/metabolite transporter (DMT)-like permease